eukprot:COSAG03_NODE_13148_length_514_cov_25.708434_1_plen_70_part_10
MAHRSASVALLLLAGVSRGQEQASMCGNRCPLPVRLDAFEPRRFLLHAFSHTKPPYKTTIQSRTSTPAPI